MQGPCANKNAISPSYNQRCTAYHAAVVGNHLQTTSITLPKWGRVAALPPTGLLAHTRYSFSSQSALVNS